MSTHTHTHKEKHNPISLKDISEENISKLVTNRIYQHIEKVIHSDQRDFIPGMQRYPSNIKSLRGLTPGFLLMCVSSGCQHVCAGWRETLLHIITALHLRIVPTQHEEEKRTLRVKSWLPNASTQK